jgi:hypothetical protein
MDGLYLVAASTGQEKRQPNARYNDIQHLNI